MNQLMNTLQSQILKKKTEINRLNSNIVQLKKLRSLQFDFPNITSCTVQQ